VLAWHLNAEFAFDPDPDRASEVEVTFTDLGDGRTEVVLEHRRLEVFGGVAPMVREQLDGDGGWGGLLATYATHA